MNIIHIDGFDHYNTLSQYYTTSGDPSISVASGRRSSKSLFFNSNSSIIRTLGSNCEYAIIGLAIWPNEIFETHFRVEFREGSTIHCYFDYDSVGTTIAVRNGDSTQIGSYFVEAFADKAHTYLEIKVRISDADGIFSVRKDEVLKINNTSVDTKNGGNSYIDNIKISNTNTYGKQIYIDDLYIAGGDVNAPVTDFLGDQRVDVKMPNADGFYTNYTPSVGNRWACIDEIPASAIDYISNNVVGNKDTVKTIDRSVTATGDIHAIKLFAIAKEVSVEGGDPTAFKFMTRIAGTDYVSSTTKDITTSSVCYEEILETNPGTTDPWLSSEIDTTDFEIGIETALGS